MLKIILFISSLGFCFSSFAAGPACFGSAEEYMVATYGNEYREDENLGVKEEQYGKRSYYVVRDRTSGTNHPVTLLMSSPGRGLCKVLTTYPVVGIAPIKFDKEGSPVAFSAQDQGTISHEIIYSWDVASGIFKPEKCMERTFKKKRIAAKEVSCDFLLEQ